ncbi:MAG: O-antigen ligase family protein [Desertifilum sp. SIO1I2]|nr:O-antigen ligase family protein [Desertifilum sp. SIO1I2]
MSRPKLLYLNWGTHYLLIAIAGCIALFYHRKQLKRVVFQYRYLIGWISLFYCWILLSAFASDFPQVALKYSLKYSTYPIAFGIFLLIPKLANQKFYHRTLFHFLAFISGWGIIEYFSPNLDLLNILRYPNAYPRISAIVQGANQLGVLMAIGAVFAIILYRKNLISQAELYLTVPIFIGLNTLSASRNGWLIFILGLGLLWLYKLIRLKGFLILISLWSFFLVFFPVSAARVVTPNHPVFPLLYTIAPSAQIQVSAPKKERKPDIAATSDEARVVLWKDALQVFSQKPLTGIGVGVFAEHIGWKHTERSGFHAHNIFLSILVELGIPGFILSIGLLFNFIPFWVFQQELIGIPLILIFASQQFDFFINDSTFVIFCTYFLANAVQQGELNREHLLSLSKWGDRPPQKTI